VPSPTPIVTTDVSIDGITNDVSRQGHGIQRAVMIAMFESLAPDEELAEREHLINDGESEQEAVERLKKVKDQLPGLLVCIEEPEIYQHPVRARAFSRVLADLSTQPRAQVLIATHSSYFVRPAQFESLRRFGLSGGKSHEAHTSIAAVTARTLGPGNEARIEKTVNKMLPTTFSEGFFADAVVLVEGDTDRVVLEELSERLGVPFDSVGISVVDIGGKGSLRIPAGILNELGIPTYPVADGDALGAVRKHPRARKARADVEARHRAECDGLTAWLPVGSAVRTGVEPYKFGAPTIITGRYTIWHDDLETELAKWPSFVAAQAANGHSARSKNVLEYRTDVLEADLDDLPLTLRTLVEAIHRFRQEA
jgi:putative ATP-dependent endonuclease of OLD family